MFSDIPYLSWIEGRPDAVAHDLASSDLRPSTAANGPMPRRLRELDDPPAEASFEALVADAYDVDTDRVLTTAGATTANAFAFAVAAEENARETAGDSGSSDDDTDRSTARVLVEKPGYEPHLTTPQGFGARVERFFRPTGVLDPARIAAATSDDTALVVLTDRHNPTGRRADRDALREAATAATDVDARLLVDEVYAPFTTTPTDGAFGGPTATDIDGTVVTGSLTKFLGLGGLRTGWLVADPEFVDAAERIQRHFQSRSAPSVHLARRAIAHHDELAVSQRDRIERNHALLADFVADRQRLSGHVHDDSTYALVEHDELDGDALTERALDDDVLVVPGRFFNRTDAVRVSVGRPTDAVTDALDAFGSVLDRC